MKAFIEIELGIYFHLVNMRLGTHVVMFSVVAVICQYHTAQESKFAG